MGEKRNIVVVPDRGSASRTDHYGDLRRRFREEVIRQDLGQYDIHDQLSAITCPTLVIQGDSSVFSVAGAEAIQQCIPSARMVVLENCGHFPFIERPNEFAQSIRTFL